MFGNNKTSEVFEFIPFLAKTDVIVPFWWMKKHQTTGAYEGTLRFNHWKVKCFRSLSPDWTITYDAVLSKLPSTEVFTIGAINITENSLEQQLPHDYHQYLRMCSAEQSSKLPEHRHYDYEIN